MAALLAVLLAAVVVAPAPAARWGATIYVSPKWVIAGRHVRVYGSVHGGCRAGNSITLISRAFPRQRTVGGLPAVSALVHRGGGFSVSILIPRGVRSGSYAVSGQCRGHYLGFKAPLKVHAPAPTTAPAGPSVTGAYSFDDEFNGSSVDLTQWDVINQQGDTSNSEPQCYVTGQTAETGGHLTETAIVNSRPAPPNSGGCPSGTPNSAATGYDSGAVMTKTASFTYGTILIRAKLSGGTTTTEPAIWLLGAACQQPNWLTNPGFSCDWSSNAFDASEVDIIEDDGGSTNTFVAAAINQDAAGSPYVCHPSVGVDVSGGYHTYELDWSPGLLTWRFDGAATSCTVSGSIVPSHAMFLIINTAICHPGVCADPPTAPIPSELPQTTSVDYVRITSATMPVNAAVPTISGTARQGHTLTAANGTWTNSPSSYTYQWQQDHKTDISGATSSTYVPAAGDVGQTLNCIVTAKNANGAAAQSSASTATVS